MALVCASKGCPPLLNQAFAPDTLDEQLNARMRAFLANTAMTRIDPRRRTIRISKVFEWYGGDFTVRRIPFSMSFSVRH